MKSCLLFFVFILPATIAAQTPGFSVSLKMDPAKTKRVVYTIKMKICEPKEKTDRGDFFTNDTSEILFASLKANEIECEEYMESYPDYVDGKELKPVNGFTYNGNLFAWERTIVFRIKNLSKQEMYVVMPIKYKSFVTHIELKDLQFMAGKVMFVDKYKASYSGMYVNIVLSLKNFKSKNLGSFSQREIL